MKDTDEEGRIAKTSRIARSCDFCKHKKIKCDQKKPCCENCSKQGEQCVYSVMKKPGLKTGYGQQVLDQINELTKAVELSKRQHDSEADILRQQLKNMEEKMQSLENRHLRESNLSHDPIYTPAVVDSGLPGIGVMPSIGPELSSSLPAMARANSGSGVRSLHLETVPPLDKTLALVDLYFKYVNVIFPILHEAVDGPFVLKNMDSSNVLLLGVLINALKFGNQIFLPEESDRYFEAIKSQIISSCFAVKNTRELKAITLLAFALYSRSNNHEAWSTISLAAGGCLHLGLTNDLIRSSLSPQEECAEGLEEWEDFVEKESLRNLVWEIYKLDRLSSMGSHFACKLPSQEIACLFPVKPEYWVSKLVFDYELIEQNQNRTLSNYTTANIHTNNDFYSSNSYIIEVLDLMDRCLSFRRSPMDVTDVKGVLSWQLACYDFEVEIQQWKKTLPSPLARFLDHGVLLHSKPSVDDVILHALYHTMIIRLHSPTAFSNFLKKYVITAQTSKSSCLNSAHLILKLSKSCSMYFSSGVDSAQEIFGPYYAFALWVSGRVLLVNSIYNKGQLDGDFDYTISVLRDMSRRWECAAKYADILDFFKDDTSSIDTFTPEGSSDNIGAGGSSSEDAKLITDIKLNASSLDSLLSKKVARFKHSKGFNEDFSVFDWFKLPLNETFIP